MNDMRDFSGKQLSDQEPEEEAPKRSSSASFIVAAIAVFALAAGGYFFLLNRDVENSEGALSGITDAVTGKPIPEEEVKATAVRQSAERKTFSFSGKAVSSEGDIVVVSTDRGEFSISFSEKTKGMRRVMRGEGDVQDEVAASAADILPGDLITIIFSKGVTQGELDSGEAAASTFIVSTPAGE